MPRRPAAARQLEQQRAVPAADVDDRLAPAPLEAARAARRGVPCPPPLRGRTAPARAMLSQPGPEVAVEGLPPGRIEAAGSLVPDPAEELRESAARSCPAEELGGRGVPVDARLDLGEDAVARERAEKALERVGVRPDLARRPPRRGEGRLRVRRRRRGSATIPVARVASAPQRMRQRTSPRLPRRPRAASLIRGRGRPRRRPRPARRRRACGSRAGADRRGRRRPPAARPAGAARRAPPRPRRRSSAARRAAARRRRRGRPSPRPRRRSLPRAGSARARIASAGSASMRSTGTSRRARSGSRYSASVPSSAASVSLSARSARCSGMAAEPLDEIGAADDDPALRAAEQLVAGEADEVGAGNERVAHLRLVVERRERARAEVVDERERRGGRRPRRARRSTGSSVKPTTRKFDWCTRRSRAVSGPIARS